MNEIIKELKRAHVEKVKANHPLAKYTTWKVGGAADLFIVPDDQEQLLDTVTILKRHGIPWLQLGRGSNMLISDKGVRGAVIKLGPSFEQMHVDETTVRAGGGYSFIRLSVQLSLAGLTGMEFAGGIPGTVGGAVYMNAGAHGSDVSRILQSAEVVLENGKLVHWNRDDMQFSYRHSRLQVERGIVTEAVFQLQPGDRKQILEQMTTYKKHRLKTQPLKVPTSGSVFRNPDGDYAARLIESCGLKGTKIGGAQVSDQHANFIVNTGQATASDILALIEKVRETVLNEKHVSLRREVLLVGER